MEKMSYANTLKKILGKDNYFELLEEVSKNVNKNTINIMHDCANMFDKYCLIILLLGTSKKVDIDMYRLQIENRDINIDTNEFAKKYEKYIKIVEDKKFEIIRTII